MNTSDYSSVIFRWMKPECWCDKCSQEAIKEIKDQANKSEEVMRKRLTRIESLYETEKQKNTKLKKDFHEVTRENKYLYHLVINMRNYINIEINSIKSTLSRY